MKVNTKLILTLTLTFERKVNTTNGYSLSRKVNIKVNINFDINIQKPIVLTRFLNVNNKVNINFDIDFFWKVNIHLWHSLFFRKLIFTCGKHFSFES